MTTCIRHAPATWRERLVLALIHKLLPRTPLIVNVIIGPHYASVQGRDDSDILADRIDFDLADFDRQADLAGAACPPDPGRWVADSFNRPGAECAAFPPLPVDSVGAAGAGADRWGR